MSLQRIIVEADEMDLFEKQIYKGISNREGLRIEDVDMEAIKRGIERTSADKNEYPFIARLFINSLSLPMNQQKFIQIVADSWRRAKNKIFRHYDELPQIEVEDIDSAHKLLEKMKEWKYIRNWKKRMGDEIDLSTMTWDEAVEQAGEEEYQRISN